MSDAPENAPPQQLVALAAWLLPGAGYWLIGQRARSLVIGITILLLFAMGLWIGGMRVVELPPPEPRDTQSYPARLLNQRPWLIGQVLTGPVSFVPLLLESRMGISPQPLNNNGERPASPEGALPASHARVNEIGTLYTAVAGMLNLLAIIDSAYRAGRLGVVR